MGDYAPLSFTDMDRENVGTQFAHRYVQSRAGRDLPMEELWKQSTPTSMKSSRGGPGSTRGSRKRVQMSTRTMSTLNEDLDTLAKFTPVSRSPAKSKSKVNIERKRHLLEIRTAELQEPAEMEEERMPAMQQGHSTFNSAAHLRSDDYWTDLLGREGMERSICRWADAKWFQTAVGAGILANSLLYGIEAGDKTPEWQIVLKHFVLSFAVFEQSVLLYRLQNGVSFRDNEERLFSILDIIAVLGCIFDQWGFRVAIFIWPSLAAVAGEAMGTMARLLWLARFLRLTRIVPALHELVHGIMQALVGLFWVFVFVFMMLFILAVICTAVIGHAELDKFLGRDTTPTAESEEVRRLFSTVGKSMFILFETMSSWSLMPLIPLFEAAPPTRIFFCIFYVYAGWTLLAVMTGTVSFTMIIIKAQIVGEDEVREQERRNTVCEVLTDIFQQLDEDGSGSLDFEEFKMILQSPDVLRVLQNNTNIKVQDLEELWDFLDDDGGGEVSVEEFMEGFQWLNEPFKPKTLMRLQEKLAKDIEERKRLLDGVATERFDSVVDQVYTPLRKIHAVIEQVQVAVATLSSVRQDLEAPQSASNSASEADLENMERNIGAQIDEVLRRISKFEVTPESLPDVPSRNFGAKRGMSFFAR